MATNTFTNLKMYISLGLVCHFQAGEMQRERENAKTCGV